MTRSLKQNCEYKGLHWIVARLLHTVWSRRLSKGAVALFAPKRKSPHGYPRPDRAMGSRPDEPDDTGLRRGLLPTA